MATQPNVDRSIEGNGRQDHGKPLTGAATERLARVAVLISNRKYELAARTLLAIRSKRNPTDPSFDYAASLASRCQRLAADRGRLQQVLDDLQDDEETMRAEIATVLGLSLPQPPQTPPAPTEPETPVHPVRPRLGVAPNLDRTARPGLSIWLLGSFRVAFDGELLVGGGGGRSSAVLRYLAALPAGGIHKEQLADRFWPEADARTARRNVHQAIYTVRRILAAGKRGAENELVFTNDHYSLGRSDRWRDIDDLASWVDVGRRARHLDDQSTLLDAHRRAYVAYGGEFLAEYPYDEWAIEDRQRHRALHREAAATLLDHHRRSDDPCSRLDVATRLLALDPTDEDACRHVMASHVELGQPHLAEMIFNRLIEVLDADLGQTPAEETLTLARGLTESARTDE